MVSVMSPTAIPVASGSVPRMADGTKTSTIYSLIRDAQYPDAITLLTSELSSNPKSRAALSLLSYCYYHAGDFQSSSQSCAQLCQLFPDVADYRFHWAQSLYKAGLYADALSVAQTLQGQSEWTQRLQQLTAAIHFEQDAMQEAYAALAVCEADDSTMFAQGCMLYRERKYEAALERFILIQTNSGPANDLTCALAATHYALKQYPAALKLLTEHIEKQVKLHPQLSVGARMDAAAAAASSSSDPSGTSPTSSSAPSSTPSVLSVGNSAVLRDSFLIEAFNLKAAIEYTLNSPQHARESLLDMPPRDLHELDIVTLHNTALLHMDQNPAENLKKLQFVLEVGGVHFPKEAFHNLLLFYAKFEYYDLCADILAENGHLLHTLQPDVLQFLECVILIQSNAAEAYRKLEQLSAGYIEKLRKVTKAIQEHRGSSDTERMKAELKLYDATIDAYLPIVMSQCRIYWERGNYEQVERLLRLNADFVSEADAFKLNLAHCLYMQEHRYKDAITYYELICKKHYNHILQVTPSILANLCVSYIMCSENEEAEELMRLIEKEEEKATSQHPDHLAATFHRPSATLSPSSSSSSSPSSSSDPPPYHLCIVNLVIGTLYCSKGNFEFGVSRVIKSFEPLSVKLNLDTWFYAKKNLLSVMEMAAKHMFVIKREFYDEMDAFLTECEKEGKTVRVRVPGSERMGEGEEWKNNVTYEARMLKRMLYKLKE